MSVDGWGWVDKAKVSATDRVEAVGEEDRVVEGERGVGRVVVVVGTGKSLGVGEVDGWLRARWGSGSAAITESVGLGGGRMEAVCPTAAAGRGGDDKSGEKPGGGAKEGLTEAMGGSVLLVAGMEFFGT